jgi:hypothetical protein
VKYKLGGIAFTCKDNFWIYVQATSMVRFFNALIINKLDLKYMFPNAAKNVLFLYRQAALRSNISTGI